MGQDKIRKDKINVVIFGMAGLDTVDIARALRGSERFNVVTWFGLFEDSTLNTFDFYRFKTDYDYKLPVPEGLYFSLQKDLYYFMDNSLRRYKIPDYWRDVPLKDGSIYEGLDNYHRYIYYIWDLLVSNEVDLVFIDGIPHCAADLVLAKIAQYLGIKLLIAQPSSFPNKFMYFTEFVNNGVDFGLYNSPARPVKNEVQPIRLERREKLFYMSIAQVPFFKDESRLFEKQDFQWAASTLRYEFMEALRLRKKDTPRPDRYFDTSHPTSYSFRKLWFDLCYDFKTHVKRRDVKALLGKSRFIAKYLDYKAFRKALQDMTTTDFSFDKPYVYFPLHFQPEVSTQCQGNQIYINQALAIEKTARLIPDDWYIYVKEHPWQSEVCRPMTFYERLKAIPNLKMVPMETSTFDLIDHSRFVSTIAGTVGWEAIKNGKNVLLFGQHFYQFLPGVFRYHDGFELSTLEEYRIDQRELEEAVGIFVARLETGVANADYGKAIENYDPKENAQTMLRFFEWFAEHEMGLPAGKPEPYLPEQLSESLP